MPLRSRGTGRVSEGNLQGATNGVESSANDESRRVRVERGRRRPPEGQSSALAGAETCRNRFQTRPPGTPLRVLLLRVFEEYPIQPLRREAAFEQAVQEAGQGGFMAEYL